VNTRIFSSFGVWSILSSPGQERGFRQGLPDNASSSAAKCGAYRQFAVTDGRTAEQQIRHIDACNQDQEGDRAGEKQEG
jgi:hypothetical protein